MSRITRVFGNVRMTTKIATLVFVGIVGSIAAVSGTIYVSLYTQSVASSEAQQASSLGVAATVLERRIAGLVLTWSADGEVAAVQRGGLPPTFDPEVIQSVTRVTKQDATIYVLDDTTKAMVARATSVLGTDGAPLLDNELTSTSAAYAQVMAGETYIGSIDLNGIDYVSAVLPIKKMTGEVMGAIAVGTPLAAVKAQATQVIGLILVVGTAVAIALGALGFFVSRLISKPIPRLANVMQEIADGNYAASVPYTKTGNEVGDMARSIEVFRQNGLRVSQMTQAEAARIIKDQEERQTMMGQLQSAFGQVVDAAVAGNFTRQVEVEFPDPELNSLAGGINNLVSTFNRGVTEIGHVLDAMARTDLTERMNGEYQGAFATLKSDINAVADKLTEIVFQLRQTSGSLKLATGEILSGANDLSERTTKQAATIEQTNAAMEQLAATVMKNAERARDASTNAIQVTRTAEEGGQVMSAATSAMQRITQSSSEISSIIGMIDDIAFQTNLLALNASVEAARAGDAGKGFAVVAVEVRRLAQSAAQASSEVKALIEQSAGDVTAGSKLVDDAANKLQTMLTSVRGNSSLLEAIAKDSSDQASAIEEVSAAVRLMDEMTQHNAALVEQTNAAIEQTEGQAAELDRIVELFRISTPHSRSALYHTNLQEEALGARAVGANATVLPARRRGGGNAAISTDWHDL